MTEIVSLGESECLELLRGTTLGRFGVVIHPYPMIFPVNYALDGDRVTFRTAADTKFNAAHYANVSFEIDHVSPSGGDGWSVMVVGAIEVVDTSRPNELERMRRLDVRPLSPGDKDVWVQVVPHRITGRRVTSDDGSFAFDSHGYV